MTVIATWLLIYSWVDCGSGVSCQRFENTVPGIASESACKDLGAELIADKRDRPRFRCLPYKVLK